MSMLSSRTDERDFGRSDSRKARRNHLLWAGASDFARLEPRIMPALTVTTFQIPLVALVEPQGITTGSDGNLWFTENGAGKIGRMTPAGVATSFALPQVPPPAGSPADTTSTTPNPTAITAGPDGALWFTGIPGEIGRITTTGVVTEFPLPAVPPPPGSKPGTASTPATAAAIVAGPDGALWFTGIPGEIGRISTAGVVTEFAVPEIPPPAGSAPGTAGTLATLTAITVGPDGALWFTGVPGEVGRITTAGVVTEFPISAGTSSSPPTLTSITAGPDGALWFTGISGEVGRITTKGVVTEYATPNFTLPSNGMVPTIVTGPDGNLWLTGQNAIGRMTPKGAFTSFNVPGNFSTIAGLTAGPGGNLWFTEREDGSSVGEQPAIGEITPAGVTTLHVIPQGTTLDPNLGVNVDPAAITTGPDGALWFTDNAGIGRMTTEGMIQQFPLTTPGATAVNITSGPDGAVWFTQQVPTATTANSWSIGRITADGAITVYPLSAEASPVAGLTEGQDGNIWFAETLAPPDDTAVSLAIGRLTPQGVITTYALRLAAKGQVDFLGSFDSFATITAGPDGNIWFAGEYPYKFQQYQSFIGRITPAGQVKLFDLPLSFSVTNLIAGAGETLWFAGRDKNMRGVCQISTNGKVERFIPAGASGSLAAGPNGQVWTATDSPALVLATRSGVVVTQDPPGLSNSNYGYGNYYAQNTITAGRDGNLWLTNGKSSIERISGLSTLLGSLDYRHRPKRAPDYDPLSYGDQWTNVTENARPSFAGVATPGTEVTLWAQKQGEASPVSIGQVKASKGDGSWTLKSHAKLSNGYYAVTAAESGNAGPPSVLYSLQPDSSGNLSNALVIQSANGGKGKA